MEGAEFLGVVATVVMTGSYGCLREARAEETFESRTTYFILGLFVDGALVVVEEEVLFFGKCVWLEGYGEIMRGRNG